MERGNTPELRYLPPDEQFLLASKVNRISELRPGDPAPFPLVTWAQDVVKALDPKLKPTGMREIIRRVGSPEILNFAKRFRFGKRFQGATEFGSIRIAENDSEYRLSSRDYDDEYRIGGYVASKYVHGSHTHLILEPFFGRTARYKHGTLQDMNVIIYRNSDLAIIGVVRNIGDSNGEVIWRAKALQARERSGARKKNLLYGSKGN